MRGLGTVKDYCLHMSDNLTIRHTTIRHYNNITYTTHTTCDNIIIQVDAINNKYGLIKYKNKTDV